MTPLDRDGGWLARLAGDERAVTTTLSYALTLSITALLASGLLITTGAFLDSQRETVARDELEVVGQQLAAKLMTADRLAETGPDALELRGSTPEEVAGSTYTISLQPGAGDTKFLVLNATSIDVSVRVSFVTRRPVSLGGLSGGGFVVVLTDAGELEVRSR